MPYLLGSPQDIAVMPNGVTVELTQPYSSFDSMGVIVVIVSAGVSLLCVLALLAILGTSLWNRRSNPSEHFFVRTHAAAYFSCLVVADLIQSVGGLMSIQWVADGGITLSPFCSAQGAIKNAGNLAISLWALMLAIHTFCLLFLRWKPKDWVLYVTLVGVWFLVGLFVVLGPAAIQQPDMGPYFGISGYWCWIADAYPAERIALEYVWMFASAGVSFILYTLTFLRLRGNILVEHGRMKFRMIDSEFAWLYNAGRDAADVEMTSVAKGMIAFPILFTVLVLPIAICRFVAWSGKDVPIEATIFADAVFQLAGVFALVLFLTTRALVPANGVLAWWFAPRPSGALSAEALEHGVQPYRVQDFASAHGFGAGDKAREAEAEAEADAEFETPARPPRPASLPPLPPLPPAAYTAAGNRATAYTAAGNRTTAYTTTGNRTTAYTEASRYTQADADADAYADAWDEVDLRRREEEEEDADGASMRFTLSAYEHEHERERERAAQTPRLSYLDSASYLDAYVNFDMVTPEQGAAAARRPPPATGRPF